MRKDILLNGEWDFMPIYGKRTLELPDKIEYAKEKILVPSSWKNGTKSMSVKKYGFDPFNTFNYPEQWEDAKSGVIARTITVSEDMKKQKIVLKFDAMMQCSAIYLNGEKLADWNEAYLPLFVDITDAAKTGENLLQVVCTEFEKHEIPSGMMRINELAGSWLRSVYLGIWQDVHMLLAPKTNIADAEIVTSVRNNKIDVFADIENTEDKALFAEAQIYDGEKKVKTIKGEVSDGKCVLSDKWDNPILWDTENPHLYDMKIKLYEGEKVIDEMQIRFGFREFWAEGQNFILNGKRVNLRGDSWHFQGAVQMTKEYALNWCRLCKERGVNSIRYHAEPHPEFYLDAADEMGILIVDETAIYGSGKSMDAASPEFIENCRKHIKRFVKRDKNHASVVIWSLENEMRWVDGRDEFKKFVPEFMDIFHNADRSKRLISLDGDNRMIDKSITEVASLHYNIDGTIDQWDRNVPLTIGEHGGLWYVCPQNSSMYIGLDAYRDHETCAEGISVKEQLFMEYARRKDVSGISSFNFAHYFAESMPNEDIILPKIEDLTTENPKIRQIKKYSLTINNGLLKDYPMYKPNVTCKYAEAGMKPVTVILREYNHSFYDDVPVERMLDVYNDTLKDENVTLEITAVQNGEKIFEEKDEFKQNAGERIAIKVSFMPKAAEKTEELIFTVKQYHDGILKNITEKTYKIYSSKIKIEPVSAEKSAYFGNDADFLKVKALLPNCEKLFDINSLKNDVKLLVIGSNIEKNETEMHDALYKFMKNGGNIIITEQKGFAFGDMTINKKKFLRAHSSEYTHPVFCGLSNDDFAYWHEGAEEDGPDSFVNAAFEKPVLGNYRMLLETSFGDFNDGGDLWSPMLEYADCGTVIASEIEIMTNFEKVPQACALLRNMIKYLTEKNVNTVSVGAAVSEKNREFLDKITVKYEPANDFCGFDVIIADEESLKGRELSAKNFAKNGGKLLILPAKDEKVISEVFNEKTELPERPCYHMNADYSFDEMKNISVVDLFGFDKVGMSPREVVNRHLAKNSVKVNGADSLMQSAEGTAWEDLFIEKQTAEYCKRAIVAYNREFAEKPQSYAVKKGNIILSQFITDKNDEKAIRFYTTLLSNIGAEFKFDAMGIIKDEAKYSIETVMTLPYKEYQDYDRAIEYYTDPEFSLNNLGEGLYGWMKKIERRPDGYLHITDSAGNTMFITCFVHVLGETDKEYILEIPANNDFTLYINGEEKQPGRVKLKAGINRFFVLAHVGDQDFALRPVFKNLDGSFAVDLQYRTTVDEIDPK